MKKLTPKRGSKAWKRRRPSPDLAAAAIAMFSPPVQRCEHGHVMRYRGSARSKEEAKAWASEASASAF